MLAAIHWFSAHFYCSNSMKILTAWLRSYLPPLSVDDATLAEDLTLRGIAVEGVFELNDASGDSDGALFDMDITTNRVDAMNHYGVAREAAAIYNLPLHALDTALPEAAGGTHVPVHIEAPDGCGRFTAQVIRGVRIGPTEGRTRHYFATLGQKSISNAVDATNFVLLGMGHPTHAFDLAKIEGGIVVRRAQAGEQLRLLDGTTRTLVIEDLVVADEVKALALAGVMGGWDSMITAETTDILVEAAWFDPASIRASSRRHLLHTDASHRFERGADFAAAPLANALVSKQILEVCGGRLEGSLVDVVIPAAATLTDLRPAILIEVATVQRLLGATLAPEGITSGLIVQYLTALGCALTPAGDGRYKVHLPSWRLDLTREIDLIEEIARVYGYNKFADTLPNPGVTLAYPTAAAEHAVRQRLLALGFTEALSSSFTNAADSASFAPTTPAVAMENPLSEEAANLRPSLVPGMVAMLALNLQRDTLNVRLFETGATFTGSAEAVHEPHSLALGLTGTALPSILQAPADDGFYELKGAIESITGLFDIPGLSFAAQPLPPWVEPGRGAAILLDGNPLGALGQLAAAESTRRKLRQPLWLAELSLETLFALPMRQATARDVSRFQAVERDFSFTFPDSVEWQTIATAIHSLAIEELQTVHPVELWRDRKKYPGVYSTLVRANFQSSTRTLTDADLSLWWASIIAALQALGGTLRGPVSESPGEA
jgi:phenylalanyl-tRNA synthetase beta chain